MPDVSGTPRDRAIAAVGEYLHLDATFHERQPYVAMTIDALLGSPGILRELAGQPAGKPGAVTLPSREVIAEMAHAAFYDHEPVPGEPLVNPWPIFADRFLALLDENEATP